MKQQYATQPKAVETHRVGYNTDVILRKNIEQITLRGETDGEEYTVYACDEKQLRYSGSVSTQTIEADFDTWWDYEPSGNGTPSVDEPDMAARLASLETQTTDIQMAMCEIFELMG